MRALGLGRGPGPRGAVGGTPSARPARLGGHHGRRSRVLAKADSSQATSRILVRGRGLSATAACLWAPAVPPPGHCQPSQTCATGRTGRCASGGRRTLAPPAPGCRRSPRPASHSLRLACFPPAQSQLDEMDAALATADAERAQKTAKLAAAGEKARRLQRMLEEVGAGRRCDGTVRGWGPALVIAMRDV